MRRRTKPLSMLVRARVSRERRAATLIELLVVFAIISLLISMLLPSLKRTMELAKTTICMHHLREIGTGLSMYGVENDGWLPSRPPEESTKFSFRGGVDVWFLKLFPTYLEEPMALTCPSDPFRYRMADIQDKADDPNVADYASYGINSLIMLGAGGKLADLDRNGPSRPGDTILLADLGPDRELAFAPPVTRSYTAKNPSKATAPKGPRRNESLLAWDDGYDPLAVRSDTWLTTRHGLGINMLTVGGSVRSVQTMQLLRSPIQNYYKDCSAGGCALCRRQLGRFLNHYTFAGDRLYWWVGPVPSAEQ